MPNDLGNGFYSPMDNAIIPVHKGMTERPTLGDATQKPTDTDSEIKGGVTPKELPNTQLWFE
jgi:hypothetical protein